MEENEEVHTPEDKHPSVTHNSWVTPGDSIDSVQKNNNSALSTTKSPINLWTMPVNCKQ